MGKVQIPKWAAEASDATVHTRLLLLTPTRIGLAHPEDLSAYSGARTSRSAGFSG
jgi:hypothetical protein